MSKVIRNALLALAAGGLLAAPAVGARERLTGEAKLAKMLEGRVAGEPESCVRTFPGGNLTAIDGTALVYKQGRTLWVNVPAHPDWVDGDDVLVTRTFGSQLCSTDVIQTVDRTTGFFTGTIFLGQFVPYRKAG